jgi:hypothetical protein
MLKAAAILFGIVFLVAGALGFVPAITTQMNGMPMLLGIFHVNTAHNIVHLASGAVFLLGGLVSTGASRAFFRVFGLVYAVVTVLGFLKGDGLLLGAISNNMPDVWLHMVLAAVMLLLGFAVPANRASA